jgi:3-oxoacyl-[acyl-carrier-protein] synthase II
MRRIVVTGLGAVTPLAAGVEPSWSRLLAGRSGIRKLPDDVVGDLPAKIGGVVPSLEEDVDAGFDPNTVFAPKDQRKVDRFILFALAAAEEALAQANWKPASETDRLRSATIIASGIGGFPAINRGSADGRPAWCASPLTVHRTILSRKSRRGPRLDPLRSQGSTRRARDGVRRRHPGNRRSARLIRADEADIAVCGGTEACMNIVSLGGFAAARSLSTGFNETPANASRPFDTERDGFVMGEGAGVLVIEELSHALARGATPIAELVGYGTTADAHHITSSPEDGGGARRAMEIAIAQAGISPWEVRHLNAHATSTPVGDLGEIEAIKSVFGRDSAIAISATKSATGHLLGAAGGLGAILTILALRDQVAPPTLNLTKPDPAGAGLDFVATQARPSEMDYAICNGFGFGGVNSSALFRRWTNKLADTSAGGSRD